MCGIATISIGKSARGRIPYHLLRKLSQEMLNQLQPRGFDAAGIAVINEKDAKGESGTCVFKKPLMPTRLTKRPRFQETLEKIGPSTNFVMLHARATTQGGSQDNRNNHPIITGPVIGIHNGTLYNHTKLFKKYRKYFKQEGDVDSEVIFHLYKHFLSLGNSPENAIKLTSSQLEGAFTGAAVDLNNRNQMVMFAFQRPLCILSIEHYDMIVTISDVKYYDRAKSLLKMKAQDKCAWVKDQIGRGFLFSVEEGKRLIGSIVDFPIPVDRNRNLLGRSYTHRSWLTLNQ